MEQAELTRDVEAIQVPGGHTVTLEKGWDVVITQSLGGSYTVQVPAYGGLFRIAGRDADALGKEPTTALACRRRSTLQAASPGRRSRQRIGSPAQTAEASGTATGRSSVTRPGTPTRPRRRGRSWRERRHRRRHAAVTSPRSLEAA